MKKFLLNALTKGEFAPIMELKEHLFEYDETKKE